MNKTNLALLAALLASAHTFASGFGLYQASAYSTAVGGTLVGRAYDGSANFNNPATLSDLTNVTVTVGFVTEHPRGAVHVRGYPSDFNMDPGMFWLPAFHAAVPLPAGFTFGLGGYAEYGLGTRYDDAWAMAWNSTETTVQGFTLNPNLAYAVTDDWSVGAGLRFLYFDFEQYALPPAGQAGALRTRLKGDNRFRDLGWQVGTRYRILDNLSVGLVYRSPIDVTVEGKMDSDVASCYVPQYRSMLMGLAQRYNGAASANLDTPQSVTLGVNWDITPTWHLGGAVSWTQWSTIDTIVFRLPVGDNPVKLGWRDTWRASVAPSWDFAEDWTAAVSYTYDMDCTSGEQRSVMLPRADRHIVGAGLVWHCQKNLDLALCYTCIFMAGDTMKMADGSGRVYEMSTSWGYCHAGGFSLTYRF